MNRRRPARAAVSHERWLVSYADFVTLLFAFFVVLYASAQVDRQRALQLSDAIRSGFRQLGVFHADRADKAAGQSPRTPGDLFSPMDQSSTGNGSPPAAERQDFAAIESELEQALGEEIRRNEVVLHMGPDGLVVTLREVGFFDSGSATMRPGAEKAFARAAAILRAHSCAVRIEGHTDNVPIHNSQFASNWELSTARASGLVRVLVDNYAIPPPLLSAAGYAEFHPASTNNTSQGRAQNRRVDLVILNSQPASLPEAASQQTAQPDSPEISSAIEFGKLESLPIREPSDAPARSKAVRVEDPGYSRKGTVPQS